MVQTLAHDISFTGTRPAAPRGRIVDSAYAYVAAAGAASRTSVAVAGRRCPSDRDLETLGIERTPAYQAVVRNR